MGVIAEESTCLGVVFEKPVIEMCSDCAMDIYTENTIDINNPYTEDIPNVYTPSPIFKIGINGTPHVPDRTKVTINGGTIAGNNDGYHVDSVAFDVNYVKALTVIGAEITRVGETLKNTLNSQRVVFVGVQVYGTNMFGSKLANPNGVTFVGDYVRAQGLRTDGDWELRSQYTFTPDEFVLRHGAAYPLEIDTSYNVKFNSHVSPGNAKKVIFLGSVGNTTPDFTGVGEDVGLLWVQECAGVERIKYRTTGALSVSMSLPMVGTSAQRPAVTGVGQDWGDIYVDTTLNKILFYDAYNQVWRDAMGTTV